MSERVRLSVLESRYYSSYKLAHALLQSVRAQSSDTVASVLRVSDIHAILVWHAPRPGGSPLHRYRSERMYSPLKSSHVLLSLFEESQLVRPESVTKLCETSQLSFFKRTVARTLPTFWRVRVVRSRVLTSCLTSIFLRSANLQTRFRTGTARAHSRTPRERPSGDAHIHKMSRDASAHGTVTQGVGPL